MVSVVVRQSLLQLRTPDEMRGRVTSVSYVFIGASNELGEFESGLTAAWWGAVPAVVVGGVGTVVVTVPTSTTGSWTMCGCPRNVVWNSVMAATVGRSSSVT